MTWRIDSGVPRPGVPDIARITLPAFADATARHIAVAGDSHTVIVYDRQSSQLQRLESHTDPVSYIRFADDGVLVTGDDDNRVWLRPQRDGCYVDRAIELPAG